MRDARLLVWLLAEPSRADHLRPAQIVALERIAAAEGLSDALQACLNGTPPALVPPDDLVSAVCDRAFALLGQGALAGGLQQLWQIHLRISQGAAHPNFWTALLGQARERHITAYVSRALRLCYHLFETPVDPFLAWQGQRSDIFFVGRLLARNGAGQESARALRWAFGLRARWLKWRARRAGATSAVTSQTHQ